MEIISQQACEKCQSLKRCIETAMYNQEIQIKCVHFGYVTRQVNELTHTITNDLAKYVDYILWKQE